MAVYVFKYQIATEPAARADGSGCVDHDLWAVVSVDGGEFTPVPNRHKTLSIPASVLQAVVDMPDGAAKVTAYKNAIASNLNTVPLSVDGWGTVALTAVMDANLAAETAKAGAVDYIVNTLHLTFPITFAM